MLASYQEIALTPNLRLLEPGANTMPGSSQAVVAALLRCVELPSALEAARTELVRPDLAVVVEVVLDPALDRTCLELLEGDCAIAIFVLALERKSMPANCASAIAATPETRANMERDGQWFFVIECSSCLHLQASNATPAHTALRARPPRAHGQAVGGKIA